MAWKKDRAERHLAEAEATRADEHRRQQAADAAQAIELREMVDVAKEFRGLAANELDERPPIVLKSGERIFVVLVGCSLIEPRSTGGHWQGGSQGVSVRVPGTRSMRYRVGSTRGTFVAGEQVQTPIDSGTCVVTTQRVVFVGSKNTREWLWTKCVAVDHGENAPYTLITVSNRQKVSGIVYSDETATLIRFRLDLALAVATGTTGELVDDLQGDLAALERTLGLPSVPLPPGSALPPPPPPA